MGINYNYLNNKIKAQCLYLAAIVEIFHRSSTKSMSATHKDNLKVAWAMPTLRDICGIFFYIG